LAPELLFPNVRAALLDDSRAAEVDVDGFAFVDFAFGLVKGWGFELLPNTSCSIKSYFSQAVRTTS